MAEVSFRLLAIVSDGNNGICPLREKQFRVLTDLGLVDCAVFRSRKSYLASEARRTTPYGKNGGLPSKALGHGESILDLNHKTLG